MMSSKGSPEASIGILVDRRSRVNAAFPQTCAAALTLSLLLATGAQAAIGPGRTVARAQNDLEISYAYVDPGIVAATKAKLAEAQRIGSPTAIRDAQALVVKAKAGMSVTRAQCLGMRPAAGGFVSFRCKLRLRDAIGFTATMHGTWTRNAATGRWKWQATSYVRDEV